MDASEQVAVWDYAKGVTASSGKFVSFVYPDPDAIYLSDILNALAQIPRWVGHTLLVDTTWSVLDHTLLCIALAKRRYPNSIAVWRAVALHDFHEAYTNDIPGPLKEMLPELGRIQSTIDAAIWKRFNFYATVDTQKFTHFVDCIARRLEHRFLRKLHTDAITKRAAVLRHIMQKVLGDTLAYAGLGGRRFYVSKARVFFEKELHLV